MIALQNLIKNKNGGIIQDPVVWQCENVSATKHTRRLTIEMWMRRQQFSILSAERCKESHSTSPK